MSRIRTYRKKPVEIQALLWDGKVGTVEPLGAWLGDTLKVHAGELYIVTLEGDMHLTVGDYIIRGVQGEFYPCKPDIFAQTYELVSWERNRDSDMWDEPKGTIDPGAVTKTSIIGKRILVRDNLRQPLQVNPKSHTYMDIKPTKERN